METLFASIDYRDPIWIAVAFAFGLLASRFGLPPLVGFLIAGFVLSALGAEGGAFLSEMADLGVTLLLFSIGLKLQVRELLRPAVWGVASLHMLVITGLSGGMLLLFAAFGVPPIEGLTLPAAILLGFALSFSSTVFAAKVLEEKDDVAAWYGRIAIGILIVQDIAAVIFLGASSGKVPSPWAPAVLLAVLASRPLLSALLDRTGHGELQILFGLVLALGGAALFEGVDMKGDLGALVFGALLAGHAKASELFKALLSLKDLFLVGFFLSVGIAGVPDLTLVLVAALLVLSLPIKSALYFWLLTRFRVRVRTSALAAQSLTSFSEFGLIVIAIATAAGWLSRDWLVTMAVAVALSFIVASAINTRADDLYLALRSRLRRFEHQKRLTGDEALHFHDAKIMVCGMGRVGSGAYDKLVERYGGKVIGVDVNSARVIQQRAEGREVQDGNLTNPDFWSRIDRDSWRIEWLLLAMPTQRANLEAAKLARRWGFSGRIGATVKFSDEAEKLIANGVDAVFNIYDEAGSGFAEHAHALFTEDSERVDR